LVTPWQDELRYSLRSAQDLLAAGFINESELPRYESLLSRYQFSLPRYYANLINPDDPQCPIRRQCIPSPEETQSWEGFRPDPLYDLKHQPVKRVTHRYSNRALLHLTPNCSMYCRFCFRKSLLNELSPDLFRGSLVEAVRYFATHPEIEEVIFSGGDPLMTSDELLNRIIGELSQIPSLRRIRFHTRVPVTFPLRITRPLIQAMTHTRLPVTVVTHFNHPREITAESSAACRSLRRAEILLLNQSVLLAKVNDTAETLESLQWQLGDLGIVPYYLHHPDRALGTRHFDVSYTRGLEILKVLKRRLPGYLVPRYVVDLPEYDHKVDVSTL
jgi:lysine 2,3-aminomutase